MSRRRLRNWSVALAVPAFAVAGYLWVWLVRAPRITDEMAGYALAERFGCHGCHGPRGTGGTPNPNSSDLEIPSWDGGTALMYVESDAEFREWILDGRPRRLAGTAVTSTPRRTPGREDALRHSAASNQQVDGPGHPPPLRMPAFKGVLDDRQLGQLVAYVKAVALWDPLPEQALRGRRAAAARGCFGCHGPAGMVGARNPKSLKGYIPPWRGKDYAELVHDERELRAWILDGRIARLDGNPVARYFTGRQVVHMPAYRDVVTPDELEDIVAYIDHVSHDGR